MELTDHMSGVREHESATNTRLIYNVKTRLKGRKNAGARHGCLPTVAAPGVEQPHSVVSMALATEGARSARIVAACVQSSTCWIISVVLAITASRALTCSGSSRTLSHSTAMLTSIWRQRRTHQLLKHRGATRERRRAAIWGTNWKETWDAPSERALRTHLPVPSRRPPPRSPGVRTARPRCPRTVRP